MVSYDFWFGLIVGLLSGGLIVWIVLCVAEFCKLEEE